MSDLQEGQAFAAAVFGRGPAAEPKRPDEKVPDENLSPEPGTPAEDALITALRREGKPWAEQFVNEMHPLPKEQESE